MKKYEQVLEEVAEFYPDSLKCDGFDEAIIGYTTQGLIVYDVSKMIDILIRRDSMGHTDALEYLHFNVFGAYIGETQPLYMYPPNN